MNGARLVKMRTGVEAPLGMVRVVTLAVQMLHDRGAGVALYELAELAKDPTHVLFGNSRQVLESVGLLEPGHVRLHSLTRDIVLASVQGEGFDVGFVSPIESGGSLDTPGDADG